MHATDCKKGGLIAGLLGAALVVGCDVPETTAVTRIEGAQFITFRCAALDPLTGQVGQASDGRAGLPLDGCGCTELAAGDPPTLRRLTQSECEARGRSGQVRAYVGSNLRGEVAVLDVVAGEAGESGTAGKRILDVDPTVPGVTGVYIDDLIADVEAHPDGRFVFTLNSTSGTISVLLDDGNLREAGRFALGAGPLFDAVVWPPVDRGRPLLDGARWGFSSAPMTDTIIWLDLDALERAARAGVESVDDAVLATVALPPGTHPAALAIQPDGHRLVVAHANAPAISIIDLDAPEAAPRVIDISRTRTCEDGFRVRTPAVEDGRGDLADPVTDCLRLSDCADGVDNDGDGLIDEADPDCAERMPTCSDGADNDGDGLIDADDSDCTDPPACASLFAGDAPIAAEACTGPAACADGVDNDGDGLIDRADPGCASDADNREVDPFDLESTPGDPSCADGVDNDDDGLIDLEDPGCNDRDAALRYSDQRRPSCGDGFDNDGDGVLDYPEDSDCYAAADDNEGGAQLELGPTRLLIAPVTVGGRLRTFLYALDATGQIAIVDLDDDTPRVRTPQTLTNAVVDMALRLIDRTASVLIASEDTALRTIEVVEPQPLLTVDGRPIFARYSNDLLLSGTEEVRTRLAGSVGLPVEAFYVIDDGLARRVTALDDLCPAAPLRASGSCPDDLDGLSGYCVPSTCRSDDQCRGGRICYDGACLAPCAGSAACPEGQWCAPDAALADRGETGVCKLRCAFDRDLRFTLAPPEQCLASGTDCDLDICQGTDCRVAFDAEAAPLLDLRLPVATGQPTVIDADRQVVHGRSDPVVRRGERYRELHDQGNVQGNALTRLNRVVAVPQGLIRNAPTRLEPDRFPYFCRFEPPTGAAEGDPAEGDPAEPALCLPVGYASTDKEETATEMADRLQSVVGGYEGVQVVEEDPLRAPFEEFRLSYEGIIPRSDSRTGQFGGRSEAGDTWALLDYNRDFCRTGIEAGDTVLIDRFSVQYDADGNPAEGCEAFVARAVELPPDQRRDPLRYRVIDVGPHKLVLAVDDTSQDFYACSQARRADGAKPPRLAPAPPVPVAGCATELISYRVRLSDTWLLAGASSGLRHPWLRDGGRCVADPRRAQRNGRVHPNHPFENESFRFPLAARGAA
ncbi:MAG: hypothetical protein KC620_07095, partial [Myxococcales bacterium]|nr:hypothetical protein [Myxococcales bacterium]